MAFLLIATRQRGSMSETTKMGTTVSLNGKPYIIGHPKTGKLHTFEMELVWHKVPGAIIATLSDYTLWHRRMGHADQHMIKHLGKKYRRWSSPNHWCTFGSLWRMWKRKVQETSFPNFKIEGKKTTWFGPFWSRQNVRSLHQQIQVYCHLLRRLLIFWGNVLSRKEKWWVCCIQAI